MSMLDQAAGNRIAASLGASNDAARGPFDLVQHLRRQIEFSERTYGPGDRTAGVCDHIRKELAEVQADAAAGVPTLPEWVDVIILGFDGAWRSAIRVAQHGPKGGVPRSNRFHTDPRMSLDKADIDDLAFRVELMQLHMQQAMQMMPLVGALLAFQEWLDSPRLPTEAQLRRARSYWREVRRSDLEFKAAFPNWKE